MYINNNELLILLRIHLKLLVLVLIYNNQLLIKYNLKLLIECDTIIFLQFLNPITNC